MHSGDSTSYEDQVRAAHEIFEERREQVRKAYADEMNREIALIRGGSATQHIDPETEAIFKREEEEIKLNYAEREARRLEALDREERERLERVSRLYGRSDQNLPVSFEEHIRADHKVFERRREDVRKSYADEMNREIALMRGGSAAQHIDPETEAIFKREEEEIKLKYAEREARRLEALDREERERLDRVRGLYGPGES